MPIRAFIVVLGVMLAASVARAQTIITLLPAGSTWKYLDNGSDQGTAWQAPDFNDSAWASGPAQLGYGDGDEATVINADLNSDGAVNTLDLTIFLGAFGSAGPVADLNSSGGVDTADLVIFLGAFGSMCP